MSTTFRYQKLPHYICQGKLEPDILEDFGVELSPCPQALVCYINGVMIGFARFEVVGKHLWGCGVWTAPPVRRKKLASALWAKILKRYKPAKVTIYTVTPAGRCWVGNLIKESDPKIAWSIEHERA